MTIPVPPAPSGPVAHRRQTGAALVASVLARILLGALALLVLVSVLPALVGWQATVVMSGSMAPAVQPGDVALVRPVDAADLRPGQVLLVDDPALPGGRRMHRLVDLEGGGLRLKGDANPRADGSLVDPSTVHGAVALRLADLGLPVLWAAQGRWIPLVGSVLALVALIGTALLYRAPADLDAGPAGSRSGWLGSDRPTRRPLRRRTPVQTAARGATAALAVGVLLAGLPGTAGAAFSATTANHANTFAADRYFSCALAANGAGAPGYFGLQETDGTTAVNSGYNGSYANGTYGGGVTYGVAGPACGANGTKAVRLDGTSGLVYTSAALNNPQTFSVQLWFSTTTTSGGVLIGFSTSSGTGGGQYDRHVYMTNTGDLVFGVYSGGYKTITSPRPYRDGAWHLMTATFSPGTGLLLYVDGAEVARDATVTSAEPYTGYWRIGYNPITGGWPSAPASGWFAGSVAHASLFTTVLAPAEIADQYAAGS